MILDEISSRFVWMGAARQQVQSSGYSSRARHSYSSMNSAAVLSHENPAAESTASAEKDRHNPLPDRSVPRQSAISTGSRYPINHPEPPSRTLWAMKSAPAYSPMS